MNFKDFLTEKLITFGGKRPKFGQVVIMAGGAGSGKGLVRKKLLGIEGRVLDVDHVKELVLKSTLYKKRVKEEFGVELEKMSLKDPSNTSLLHKLVSELGISNKSKQNLFSSIFLQPEDRKPNVIFDVTLKDVKKLIDISEEVVNLGYKKENIHIVWVINSVDTAMIQNTERPRMVNPDILMDTHRGVSQTIRTLIDDPNLLKRYIDGDFWFVFNDRFMKDVDFDKSKTGGSYINKALYIKIKEKGQNVKTIDQIDKDIVNKIKSYVPKSPNWES